MYAAVDILAKKSPSLCGLLLTSGKLDSMEKPMLFGAFLLPEFFFIFQKYLKRIIGAKKNYWAGTIGLT